MHKKWWKYLAALAVGVLAVALAVTVTNAGARYHSTPDAEEHEEVVANRQAVTGSCGVERWSVKTGTDTDAGLINLQATTATSISSLGAITAPGTLPANNRVQPTETTVFRLRTTLTEYKLEADSDYHLVLDDQAGHTMIAEIPDPACVGSTSPLLASVQKARGEFNAKYTPTGSFQTANAPVTVTGVGFFDFKHGQTGVAPNGIELHSVLDVQFGAASGGSVTVAAPGNQTGTVGAAATLQMSSTDTAGGTLRYSATGLPAGLAINSSTGLISGTPTTAGTSSVTVTATDSTGPSGSASFTWTVSPSGTCAPGQVLGNPGFETGTAAPWTATSGVISNSANEPPHTGSWYARLDGRGTAHTDTLAQQVALPPACGSAQLSFWLHIDTAETGAKAYDTLKVQILNASGTVLAALATYSNLNAAGGYTQHAFDLSAYKGQTVTVQFIGAEDYTKQTSFVVDDTALNVS
ncbi:MULTISPECIES: putative Ig domain-containing protein [unclassified Streptomyces]|uniref:putative Ig domain-containing protein n=1 Tax=unclassified Streptomyces TaxID=2593676 RepID=UPI00380399CC